MKHLNLFFAAVSVCLFTGCITQKTFVTSSRDSKDKIFDALQSTIAQKNYNILDANKGAGFIRAEKATLSAALRFMSGMENYDQLQVTVFNQNGASGVRVQAMSFQEKTNGYGVRSRETTAPSEEVARDAQELLRQFGGEVSELKQE
jgi:hypothetical protein